MSRSCAPATSPTLRPPALPREIIDSILTALIALYDHDPTYQWTHFRSLTSFHRQQLDKHFPKQWMPKLTLTLYDYPDLAHEYYPARLRKRTGIVEYRMKYAANAFTQETDLHSTIMGTTWPVGDDARRCKRLILRLGEGILHDGASGGGIISDVQLPELCASDDGTTICFNWKAAFTALFGEEMLMRRYKDAMFERFLPTVKARKRLMRNREIHMFLRKAYQPMRRKLLTRYRDHLSSFALAPGETGMAPIATPFDVEAHVPADLHKDYRPQEPWFMYMEDWKLENLVVEEESMVVHIPGWEFLPESELSVLRRIEPCGGGNTNQWCSGG